MLLRPADVQNALPCLVVLRRFHRDINLHKNLFPAKINEYRFWPSGKIFGQAKTRPVKERKDDNPWLISLKIVRDIVEMALYLSFNTELGPKLLRKASDDIELTGYMLHKEENIHLAHLHRSLVFWF